jgi:SAM-dependent methyltransferase
MSTCKSNIMAVVAQEVGYQSLKRYQAKAEFIFNGIPLVDQHVLDIGCGRGAWVLWAALHGSKYALGIEPEADGSDPGTIATFRSLIHSLKLGDYVEASSVYLQDLKPVDHLFDVVLLYNVINHLDESAVQTLHQSQDSVQRYILLLKQIYHLLAPNAYVIVADCSRFNFWNRLGIRSPFAPTIEWHKHQNPETWIYVFDQAGFDLFDLRWSPLYPLGQPPCNRAIQFLTTSHFVLRFRARPT